MLSVSRRIRIRAGCDRILAPNAAIPALNDEFAPTLLVQGLPRRIDRFALSLVDAPSAAGIVALLGPLIVLPINGSVAAFAHAVSLLSGPDVRNPITDHLPPLARRSLSDGGFSRRALTFPPPSAFTFARDNLSRPVTIAA
jgi:hypothetical protein